MENGETELKLDVTKSDGIPGTKTCCQQRIRKGSRQELNAKFNVQPRCRRARHGEFGVWPVGRVSNRVSNAGRWCLAARWPSASREVESAILGDPDAKVWGFTFRRFVGKPRPLGKDHT